MCPVSEHRVLEAVQRRNSCNEGPVARGHGGGADLDWAQPPEAKGFDRYAPAVHPHLPLHLLRPLWPCLHRDPQNQERIVMMVRALDQMSINQLHKSEIIKKLAISSVCTQEVTDALRTSSEDALREYVFAPACLPGAEPAPLTSAVACLVVPLVTLQHGMPCNPR